MKSTIEDRKDIQSKTLHDIKLVQGYHRHQQVLAVTKLDAQTDTVNSWHLRLYENLRPINRLEITSHIKLETKFNVHHFNLPFSWWGQ